MTPDAASSPHSLASATGLLLGALLVSAGAGALIGWAAGAADLGLIVGGLVGILLGIVAVYVVYSRAERA
jgi:F0F1-type ATP synthase assembly protein I